MKETYKIYPGVEIGENAQIGDFVIIGLPARGAGEEIIPTIIGGNAVIRSHTVIYAGNRIGHNFQTGHGVMIREDNEVGNNVSIGTDTVIEHHVKIGDGVRIHSQVFVPEYSILEERCWLGPNVVLTNALHPVCPKAKACLKGPTVKKEAKIGANTTILPDLVIGERALIGAGSVVVSDVAAGAVMVGNPAKMVKKIEDLMCRYGLINKPY